MYYIQHNCKEKRKSLKKPNQNYFQSHINCFFYIQGCNHNIYINAKNAFNSSITYRPIYMYFILYSHYKYYTYTRKEIKMPFVSENSFYI